MNISKKLISTLLIGLIIGGLLTTAIRFVMIKDDRVHYHANFSLYVYGQQDKFEGPGYYEEETACTSSNSDNPKTRVHLHDQNPGLIHVHDNAVMWTDLFANIGYGLSNKSITTNKGTFVDGQDDNKLTFVLNGKVVSSINGKLISSEDRLLINYGKDDQTTLDQRYNNVPKDAHEANSENDPASCSGSEPITFTTKLKKAIGI